jgi:DNA polymerase-3 subunit alpha
MSIRTIKESCEKRLNELKLNSKEYSERLEKELRIIELNNSSEYFLECIEKTKKNGKISNSNHMLISFLLGITDEDPIKNKLELNIIKYAEFPDIDSDFEDEKRELVKEYLINKYGERNVASIIAFGKIKAKNAIKDISRVKGIPFDEVNEVNKHMRGGAEPDTIESGYNHSPEVKAFFDKYSHYNLYELCKKLEGNVRQPSKHAAGIVVSPVELDNVVGLMKVKGLTVTSWEEGVESKDLSQTGLVKIDLLGLKTLTVIHKTCDYIKETLGIDIPIRTINLDDSKVIKLFNEANTIGVFQFEKPAVRDLIKNIKISCFEDISATNALNRPGPLGSGMDETFWKVKNKIEPEKYLHNSLEPVLKVTYGTILYQEQLIRIVQDLAGMTTDEADIFRKVLTKEAQAGRSKGINPLEKYEKKFISGCIKNGIAGKINVTRKIYDDSEIPSTAKNIQVLEEDVEHDTLERYKIIKCDIEVSDEIWHQMKSFANYGFNKSHSSAYAKVAYQSAYLKAYYPLHFMSKLLSCAPNTINRNDNINYFTYYIDEAKRMGIKILPPDVNKSMSEFTIEDKNIRSGFFFIKGIGLNAIKEIIEKRPYKNIKEFLMKTNPRVVNKRVFHALTHCGAFDSFLESKKDITYRYEFISEFNKVKKNKETSRRPTLLQEIEEEIKVCGGEIFNTSVKAIDLNDINKSRQADDKIMDFKTLEKINVKSAIRTYGKIERFSIGKVGFLTVKNGSEKQFFTIWKDGLAWLEQHPEVKGLLTQGNLISFRTMRGKDWNGRKSFVANVESIEPIIQLKKEE